jgi:hypothetical protein
MPVQRPVAEALTTIATVGKMATQSESLALEASNRIANVSARLDRLNVTDLETKVALARRSMTELSTELENATVVEQQVEDVTNNVIRANATVWSSLVSWANSLNGTVSSMVASELAAVSTWPHTSSAAA